MASRTDPSASLRVVADDSDNDSNATDEEQAVIREAQMAAIALHDLGTATRNLITSADDRGHVMLTDRQINQLRAVNDPNSQQQKLFRQHQHQTTAWSNFHTTIDPNEIGEDEDIMGGQTHRAAVQARLRQERLLNNGEIQLESLGNAQRGRDGPVGRGHGVARGRGGGVMGTRGRGFPITGTNRPLDPAVDPYREYTYKSKTTGRSIKLSHGKAAKGDDRAVKGAKSTLHGNSKGKTVNAKPKVETPPRKANTRHEQKLQKTPQRPARQLHVLPAWFGELQENPPPSSAPMTLDMKIAAACAPARSAIPEAQTETIAPKVRFPPTAADAPSPLPSLLANFSMPVKDLSHKFGSSPSIPPGASPPQYETSTPVAPPKPSPTTQHSLDPRDPTMSHLSKVQNSPLSTFSKGFMESLATRPFDPNMYGAPQATTRIVPPQKSEADDAALIKKVPVSELSLHKPIVVEETGIGSAFTDGNPTPATMSAFSGSPSPLVYDESQIPAETPQGSREASSLLGLGIDVSGPTGSVTTTDLIAENLAKSPSGHGIDLMSDDAESINSPILVPGRSVPARVIVYEGHTYHLVTDPEKEKHVVPETVETKSSSERSFTTAQEPSPKPEAKVSNSPFRQPSGLSAQSPDTQDSFAGSNRIEDNSLSGLAPEPVIVRHGSESKNIIKTTQVLVPPRHSSTKAFVAEAPATSTEPAPTPRQAPTNPFKPLEVSTTTNTVDVASDTVRGAGPSTTDGGSLALPPPLAPKWQPLRTPGRAVPNPFDTDSAEEPSLTSPYLSLDQKIVLATRRAARAGSSRLPPLAESKVRRNHSPPKPSTTLSSKWASPSTAETNAPFRSAMKSNRAYRPEPSPIFGDERNVRRQKVITADSPQTPTSMSENEPPQTSEYYGRLVSPPQEMNMRGGEGRAPQAGFTSTAMSAHTGRVAAKAHSGLTPVVEREEASETESEL